MAEKQDSEGLQPDGSLIFSVLLPPPLSQQFLEAMKADEREVKAEFARVLIRRQLNEISDRKAFEEFKRLRANQSGGGIPHFPGTPPVSTQKVAG